MKTIILTVFMILFTVYANAAPFGFFDFEGIYSFEIIEEDAAWESDFGYVYINDKNTQFEIFNAAQEVGATNNVNFSNKLVGFYYNVTNTGETYKSWVNSPSNVVWNNSAFYLDDNGGGYDQDYNDMTVSYSATPIPSSLWLLGSGLLCLIGLKKFS